MTRIFWLCLALWCCLGRAEAAYQGCPANFTQDAVGCHWTQTASNSASIQWTGLTGSDYRLRCHSIVQATATEIIYLQFGEGGTPTWETANYSYSITGGFNNGTGSGGNAIDGGSFGDSGIFIGYNTNAAPGTSSIFDILSLSATTNHRVMGTYITLTSNATGSSVRGEYTGDTTAITAIRVISQSGNLTSGSCTLDWLSN